MTSSWARANSSAARMFGELGLDAVEPLGRARPVPRLLVVARERDRPGQLRTPEAVVRELGRRVRADRLEHGEPGLGATGQRRGGEARVEERVERAGHVGPGFGDPLQRLERRARGEDDSAASTCRAG